MVDGPEAASTVVLLFFGGGILLMLHTALQGGDVSGISTIMAEMALPVLFLAILLGIALTIVERA